MESVLVTCTHASGTYILHTTGAGTRVAQVDPFVGQLVSHPTRYGSEEEALLALGRRGDVFLTKQRACMVMGLALGTKKALLVLATKLREVRRRTLPSHPPLAGAEDEECIMENPHELTSLHLKVALPRGSVFVVAQSTVIELPLLLGRDDADGSVRRAEETLLAAPLAEVSYFAPNLDITRPWASAPLAPCDEPESSCVWNVELRAPFVAVGLGELCPPFVQGYCARRKVSPSFCYGVVARRCGDRMEVDFLCWNGANGASFTWCRSGQPVPLEECLVAQSRSEPLAASQAVVLQLQCGSTEEEAGVTFDWARACKMQGRAEGAAGEAYNAIGERVRAHLRCATFPPNVGTGSLVVPQRGMLVVSSPPEGLKARCEFALFFSLCIAAELERVIGLRPFEAPWAALRLTPTQCATLLGESARCVASLAVEVADAETFLLAGRESLLAGSEVAAFLPASLLASPLHRLVGAATSPPLPPPHSLAPRVRLTAPPVASSWTQLVAAGMQWVVPVGAGGRVEISIPFSRPGRVSHWALSLHGGVHGPHPVRFDLLLGGCVVAAGVPLPIPLGSPLSSMVFPVRACAWDVMRTEGDGRHVLDDHAKLVLYAPQGADTLCLGSISFFGAPEVLLDPLAARRELWRLRVGAALASPSTRGDIVAYVTGEFSSTEGAKSGCASGAAAVSSLEEKRERFLATASQTDPDSLLSLLMLERVRLSLELSESQRDTFLYEAGMPLPRYDPRRLLYSRDGTVESWIRAAVPASFLACASGLSCRGRRFTLSSGMRNRPCFQCRQRFCAKCMETASLLEQVDPNAPVCFLCAGEIAQERDLLVNVQKRTKAAPPLPDSPTEIACRHLLGLCAQIAQVSHEYAWYPFVRCAGAVPCASCTFDICFTSLSLVPLDLYWSAPLGVQHVRVSIQLPFAAVGGCMWLIPPPLGWPRGMTACAGDVCVETIGCKDVKLPLPSIEGESIVGLILQSADPNMALCVGRVKIELEPRVVKPPLRRRDVVLPGKEVWGPRSGGVLSTYDPPSSASALIGLLEQIGSHLRNVPRLERRNGGRSCDMWLVKVRGTVLFRGGFVLHVVHGDDAQCVPHIIHVRALVADNSGVVCGSKEVGSFLVPRVLDGTLLHFAFAGPIVASALAFEFVSKDVIHPEPEVWLSEQNDSK